MGSNWEHFGEIGNVVQLTGLNAVALIGLIVKTASSVRLHKRNCKQFALHLKLIGNLLEQLKISELKSYPETQEPLEQLEDALKRAYLLVQSCRERSYLYLLAMGWNIVYQFRRAQEEIDRYLQIMPLISLVNNARIKERLESIQQDQREYMLDEEDRKVHAAIMSQDPSKADTVVLKKTLSHSYPNLLFDEALQKENEKLKEELLRSQSNMDVSQCEVLQHLIEVTEAAAKNSWEMGPNHFDSHEGKRYCANEKCPKKNNPFSSKRNSPSVPSGTELPFSRELNQHEEWHTDLLDCLSDPQLCMRTVLFPCGTFSKIASVATNKHMTSAEACNELIAYSLILACCCYTCCIRRKLRKALNIKGGWCDDFLSHVLCCCCSLVQEWREVEICGVKGPLETMTMPPPPQHIES
ncbi:hypothetical protein Nepgr_025644 [Nepenthes gracilis]|uniref:MCAfunc domain-containing protein n=1 Tax=Nepenthes gracilis TaxID=150966 RepID=A0AAD3T734_NEPGR|nr:hypothetical protein Nepgr_025644 [Nepenthes gracilis]